jgi:hypothetical protein
MTGVPPPSKLLSCPLPPADLHSRRVPEIALNMSSTPMLRVHRTRFSPIFFNRRSRSSHVYRFDAPADEYGVLYASPEFDACLAETVIRDRFQTGALVIDEFEITDRSISTLGLVSRSDLLLADLTAPLFAIGGSAAIASVSEYEIPNQWSKALHDHPKGYDGIYFLSRYSNMPSVALFDRVDVSVEQTTKLEIDSRLPAFLDRYDIAIV